jgi:hypothetical protein
MLAWYDNVGGSFLFRIHMIAVVVGQAFLSSPVFSFCFFFFLTFAHYFGNRLLIATS